MFRHLWAAAAAVLLAACATPPAGPLSVKVLAINDFHGNLQTPGGGLRIRDPNDAAKTVTVRAGGAAHLATAVAELRARNPNHVFVAAGDLVGASPLISALFHDEPTVEALSMMGLEASAVGNHEFDRGSAELLRLQRGGCHPTDGCKGPQPFAGARFQYLAASTVDATTGRTILPPVFVKRFEGVPVAFIGLTLKDTPQIVVPAGVAGLRFADEADTVNALVPGLRAQGIEAIVLLIHEGGQPAGDYNECPGLSGPIVDIVKKLDRAVDVVISGHTHRAYNCRLDGRLVTSADKYGTIVSEIDLTIDRRTRDVVDAKADNVIVRPERFAGSATIAALVASYERLAAPLAKRVVGRIAAPLTRDETPAGETPIGQVVADAQLAASRDAGAAIALMNPGGLRAALGGPGGGEVTYEQLFAVQPFSNNLVTVTLTGAQLLRALEEQWIDQPRPRILQVSRGFAYQWDAARPVGQRVVPGSVTLNGAPIEAAANYRVTINSFLADGGDNFRVFKQATERRTGLMDIDAFERYVASPGGPVPGSAEERIRRAN
jgi:5'-nucleotidase